MKVIELEDIDSTNDFCKRICCEENVIVVAERQLKGRGTKGRSFVSEEGGLYISVMRHYENFNYKNTFSIMINACVAVCETVAAFGLKPTIKWANDVLVEGKKICGTLIENRLGSDNVCTSIVGIGLNVNNVLDEELKKIATTMQEQKRGKQVPLKKVREKLLKNLQNEYTIADYKKYVDWFGKDILLDRDGVVTTAKALDIAEDGCLVCRIDGQIQSISSAEISIKLS